MQLLVGTNNRHKAEEILSILEGLPAEVLITRDLGIDQEPEESGATFHENALIKARFYSALTNLPCLADDSGLVVDALDGRPGVYSSRYAPTNAERISKLLDELKDVPQERRTARFVCVAALVSPPPHSFEKTIKGTCEGVIAFQPKGEGGFGYDPVFYLPELEKTMAEMTADEKNILSHRGRALEAIRPALIEVFTSK